MRHTRLGLLSSLLAVLTTFPVSGQTSGPDSGTLVIVGGGARSAEIFRQFIDLAGGPDAPIVVIPTAGGGASYDQYCRCARPFKDLGASDVTVVHTYDRSVADSESFVGPIRRARAVWFSGGRQWRLVDAYADTRVLDELVALLERGGVIGGSSAGATIQGSFLARGDTRTNTIMMGDHQEGFGFLTNAAIDQHLLRRNRHFDLIEIVTAHPNLLGIGIDEDTAIIVRGNRFDVIGSSLVAIYDHQSSIDTGGEFYFMGAGDWFDLETRTPYRVGEADTPLERVSNQPWNH